MAGVTDAYHGEYADIGQRSDAGRAVVSMLACSLADDVIDIEITQGSKLHSIYDSPSASERTTCNYGLNPEFAHVTSEAGMIVGAVDDTGEVRSIERTDHRFFIGTLYQPQLTSEPGNPHPIFAAFIDALAR